MRLTPREVSSRGGGCDVTCRLTSGRNALRGFPQVNIPPSSSLQHHYSRSDRLLTSDPASGRPAGHHGNSPAGRFRPARSETGPGPSPGQGSRHQPRIAPHA
jgi:hypothetical protein